MSDQRYMDEYEKGYDDCYEEITPIIHKQRRMIEWLAKECEGLSECGDGCCLDWIYSREWIERAEKAVGEGE